MIFPGIFSSSLYTAIAAAKANPTLEPRLTISQFLKPHNPGIDKLYLGQERRSTDYETLKP